MGYIICVMNGMEFSGTFGVINLAQHLVDCLARHLADCLAQCLVEFTFNNS